MTRVMTYTAGDVAAAFLTGVACVLLIALLLGIDRWVNQQVDEATTLPDPRRAADDDTTRIDPALHPHDPPRIREDHWL